MTLLKTPALKLRQKALAHLIGRSLTPNNPFVNYKTAVAANMIYSPKPVLYKKLREEYEVALFPAEFDDAGQIAYDDLMYHQFLVQCAINLARCIFHRALNILEGTGIKNVDQYDPGSRVAKAATAFFAAPSPKTLGALFAADYYIDDVNRTLESVVGTSRQMVIDGIMADAIEKTLRGRQYSFRILKDRLAIYLPASNKAVEYTGPFANMQVWLAREIAPAHVVLADKDARPSWSSKVQAQVEAEAKTFYEFLIKGSSALDSAHMSVNAAHKAGWSVVDGFGASALLSAVCRALPAADRLFKLLEEEGNKIKGSKNAPYWYLGLTRSEDTTVAHRFASAGADPEEKVAGSMRQLVAPPIKTSLINVISMDLARYITQTPEGNISYSTFANWFQQYLYYYWERFDAEAVPTYVIPLDKMDDLYGDKSQFAGVGRQRLNEDGMFIDGDGRISYMPEVTAETTKHYMEVVDELMTLTYKGGGTLSIDRQTEDVGIRNKRTAEEAARITELKNELKALSSLPIALNWNVGAALRPYSENPAATDTINLLGAKPLDVRSTADLLSKNPKEFYQYMTGSHKDLDEADHILDTVRTVMFLYQMAGATNESKLPSLSQVWKTAAKAVNFEITIDKQRRYETLYLEPQFGPEMMPTKWGTTGDPMTMISRAQDMAKTTISALSLAGSRSRLTTIATSLNMKIDDAPFYNPEILYQPISQLTDLAAHYLVLDVFFRACSLLSEAFTSNPKLMFEISSNSDYQTNARSVIPSTQLLSLVLPMVHIFGKYIPNYRDIHQKAAAAAAACAIKPEDKIRTMEEAMAMAPEFMGAKGMALFPHQVEVNRRLERSVDEMLKTSSANDVMAAVLDIDPGGGKTTQVLCDAVNMMRKGLCKRPLIVVPTPLTKNWKDDLDKFTDEGFNIVVITSRLMNAWKLERYQALLANMPANSILIVAIDWLSRWSPPKQEDAPRDDGRVLYGTVEIRTFPSVQLLRTYAPDYIGVDESHFVKNPDSDRSQAVQALVGLPTVRFLRLASGTIVTDKPTDLVGQIKLINPYVYGSTDAFERTYKDPSGSMWRAGAAQDIRARLNQFMPVLTYKRSEWAFMLPYPVENIRQVRLPDSPDYRDLYQMMYKETLEEIKTTNPKLYKVLIDGDESNAAEIEAALQNLFMKLEQFLIAPEVMLKDREEGPKKEALKKRIAKLPLSPKLTDPDNGVFAILKEHFDPARRKKANLLADKVMIFCRYKGSVDKIYKSLPPEFKKVALTLTGDDQSALAPFNDPKSPYQLLICTEQTVNTGKNLQIASRIIRVELPWSPGEQDQAMARVMRPTPPAYDQKTGKFKEHAFKRERIFMDTVIVESTLEVAKMARLISKIGIKAKFDHYGKAAYDALPELEIIRMNLDAFDQYQTLADIGGKSDGSATPNSHLDVYQRVKVNELEEFKLKRETQLTEMIPVKSLPLPPNSIKLPIDLPAMSIDGVPNAPPAKSIYDILTKTFAAAKKSVKGWSLDMVKGGKKLKSVLQDVEDEQEEVKTIKTKTSDGKVVKTKVNEKGKPTKTQVTGPRDKTQLLTTPNEEADGKVVLDVITVNGLITIVVDGTKDADVKTITKAVPAFKMYGRFAYTWIPNVPRLNSVVASLQAHFNLRPADVQALEQFKTSFINGKKFSAKRAAGTEVRNYYLENHKPNNDKKALRIYPVVYDGELYVMTDMSKQAAGRVLAQKRKLKGSPAIWETWDSTFQCFVKDKNELIRTLKAIKAVINIENEKEVAKQVNAMLVTGGKKKPKT